MSKRTNGNVICMVSGCNCDSNYRVDVSDTDNRTLADTEEFLHYLDGLEPLDE
jgi:hypothetical protein